VNSYQFEQTGIHGQQQPGSQQRGCGSKAPGWRCVNPFGYPLTPSMNQGKTDHPTALLGDFPSIRTFLNALRKATGVQVQILPMSPSPDRNGAAVSRTSRNISVPVRCCNKVIGCLVVEPADQGEQEKPASSTATAWNRLSPHQRDGVEQLLQLFASHLSSNTDLCVLATSMAEPPCVGRARDFIRANLHELLSLSQVAKTIGFCTDHLGRMFSRATGLTFTQYVQRARTEKAKELLADREQRVSEVAFASGFQSIPHFNRVFRRLTGIAPTTYRANLFKAVSRNVESYLGKKKSANA